MPGRAMLMLVLVLLWLWPLLLLLLLLLLTCVPFKTNGSGGKRPACDKKSLSV